MNRLTKNKAQALIITFGMAVVLMITSVAFLSKLINEASSLDQQQAYTEALYLAEGGMASTVDYLQNNLDSIRQQLNLEEENITFIDHQYTYLDEPFAGTVLNSKIWPIEGLNNETYAIQTSFTYPEADNATITLYKTLQYKSTSPLDYVLFDKGERELEYRFANINGKLFINGDFWMAAGGDWFLPDWKWPDPNLTNRIYTTSLKVAGTFLHWPKDKEMDDPGGGHIGETEISFDPNNIYNTKPMRAVGDWNVYDGTQLNYPDVTERDYDGWMFSTIPADNWPQTLQSRWNGIVQDKSTGVQAIEEEKLAIDVSPEGNLALSAGLIIEVDEWGDIAIFDVEENRALVPYDDFHPEAITVEFHPDMTPIHELAKQGEFYDIVHDVVSARIILDVEKLAAVCPAMPGGTCDCKPPLDPEGPIQPFDEVPCLNQMPDNGLIYITRKDMPIEGNSWSVPAASIRNAEEIHLADDAATKNLTGLTVATNLHYYTEGNINTINPKPLLLIGDSHTILSNNYCPDPSVGCNPGSWTDTDTAIDGSRDDFRRAAETSVRAAFVSGHKTGRVFEKWGWYDGKPRTKLFLTGSFIKLNDPVFDITGYAQFMYGGWHYWEVHELPFRFFTWDSMFSADLPPYANMVSLEDWEATSWVSNIYISPVPLPE
ncbi:hypothetical protein ACFL38_05380 [Candidatus Omnitrophota bacterium]